MAKAKIDNDKKQPQMNDGNTPSPIGSPLPASATETQVADDVMAKYNEIGEKMTQLRTRQEQSKEVWMKCQGAIEVLGDLLNKAAEAITRAGGTPPPIEGITGTQATNSSPANNQPA